MRVLYVFQELLGNVLFCFQRASRQRVIANDVGNQAPLVREQPVVPFDECVLLGLERALLLLVLST